VCILVGVNIMKGLMNFNFIGNRWCNMALEPSVPG